MRARGEGRIRKRTAYAAVVLIALATTVAYTGDLEMAWLAAFLLAPVWGLFIGFAVGGLLRLVSGASWKAVLSVALFSVALHSALMVEEAAVGGIRGAFRTYTEQLNRAEQQREVHEVPLGADHTLYFAETTDDVFQLTFAYDGRETVSRDQILLLASHWLADRGYGVAELRLDLYHATYRKQGLSLAQPGAVTVAAEVHSGPLHNGHRVSDVFLALAWQSDGLGFRETAWAWGE